jgi:hypothetical protein
VMTEIRGWFGLVCEEEEENRIEGVGTGRCDLRASEGLLVTR